MIVYIAGPYTKGDVAQNVNNAIKTADQLLNFGYTPFIPHLTHFWHLISPKPWQTWMQIDFEMLKRCDAVLRMEGESKGANLEVEYARSLGIPVYYSIEEISRREGIK